MSALVGSLLVLGTMNLGSAPAPALRGRRLQYNSAQYGREVGGQMVSGAGDLAGQVHEHATYHASRVGHHLHFGISSFFEYIGDYCRWFTNHIRDAFYNITRALSRFFRDPLGSIETLLSYCPWSLLTSWMPESWQFLLFVSQVVFAVVYYFMVVSYYPYWYGPTPMSAHIQSEMPPVAAMHASPANMFLSLCCPQARAAHTFDKTGILEYWFGVLAMFCCPFCTLCWANACTDLNPKLGGWPADPLSSAACTWCCAPCVIAQDAESLDACTGARTEPCGVSYFPSPMPPCGPVPTPYSGGGYGGYGGYGPYGGPMY